MRNTVPKKKKKKNQGGVRGWGEGGKPRALAVDDWLEPQKRGGASVPLFL